MSLKQQHFGMNFKFLLKHLYLYPPSLSLSLSQSTNHIREIRVEYLEDEMRRVSFIPDVSASAIASADLLGDFRSQSLNEPVEAVFDRLNEDVQRRNDEKTRIANEIREAEEAPLQVVSSSAAAVSTSPLKSVAVIEEERRYDIVC